jgi:hypothetical protein
MRRRRCWRTRRSWGAPRNWRSSRTTGADAERAQLTVTKVIKSALEKVRANQPELARYLAASIKTGYFCGYTPDPKRPGTWVL